MTKKKLYISLLICTIGSIGLMTLLFAFTQKELQRDTSFLRGFLPTPPNKVHQLDLEYNGYYIAGTAEDKIYLSNTKSPLYLIAIDTALQNKQEIHLTIDQDSLPLRSPQVRVISPYFFLMDGTIPYVLRGNTTDWKAYSILENRLYFTNAEPIDSTTLAIRTISKKTQEFTLGTIHLSDSSKMTLSHKLLQKQVDGIFDVDGTLQYNRQRKQLIYTYRYRNQYIVANDSLELQFLGKTIDTISQAQIKIGTISSKNQQKMAAPALKVNKYSATSGNYLFVNSKLLGNRESLILWKKSSVIDVYNIVDNSYKFSFHVEDIGENKLKSFYVLDDKFIGLIGNHIVIYQLRNLFNNIKPSSLTNQNNKQKTQNLNSNTKKNKH
ncbi:hypothetical protein [Flavivirga spongiicola]|uniref:DUF4340 domain-containing protein n=1 Tax=Flavivirga spongiicola TaxID=421621 RepID=A0ABU7XRX1_9FLAO|nr:hypothetical protein [Flavivirga sp. MEBiC05379]MDO5978208.1 hypothetical protein [Flavivirga sp. MEBiC05379]